MNDEDEFEVEIVEPSARVILIYHPEGQPTKMQATEQIDCEVQSGFLVVRVGGNFNKIYHPKDWVSVNVRPRH